MHRISGGPFLHFARTIRIGRRGVPAAGSLAAVGTLFGRAPNKDRLPTHLNPTAFDPSMVSAQSLSCLTTPALTEGPYFVDERLNRSDIRRDPSDGSIVNGVMLHLTVRVYVVSPIDGLCIPLTGAALDVWQCNELGVYSDVSDAGFSPVGRKFLRGYQITDLNGTAHFTTIYPGWCSGRAVHIHFKVRTNPDSTSGYEFTSQWFLNDTLTDQVHLQLPYAAKGLRDTRNNIDSIYAESGGKLTLNALPSDSGYTAIYTIGLNIQSTGSTTSSGAGGGPPAGGIGPDGTPPVGAPGTIPPAM